MATQLVDRFYLLLAATSLKDLADVNSKEYVRWQNIKRGRARVGAEEIQALACLYPAYRWWLLTGEVRPEWGQISPKEDNVAYRNKEKTESGN